MTDDEIERGATEDESGVPVTPTEVEASRVPPSEGGGHAKEPAGKDAEDDPQMPPTRR